MKARYRRVQHRDLRSRLVNVDDLYRVRPWPKPRRERRLRRRRAARWAAMSPEERALHELLARDLLASLNAELDAQLLWGDGLPVTSMRGVLGTPTGVGFDSGVVVFRARG